MASIQKKLDLSDYIGSTPGYFKILTNEQFNELYKMFMLEKPASRIRSKAHEYKKLNKENNI